MKNKTSKKIPKESLVERLDLLRIDGLNICRHAYIVVNEEPVGGELEQQTNPRILFQRYQRWFMQLKELLDRPKITKVVDIEILFREPVPMTISREAYLYRRVFAEDIIAKTEKKLDWLEENYSRLVKLLLRSSTQKLQTSSSQENQIKVITIIGFIDGHYELVVNDNFLEHKKIQNTGSWGELIKAVRQRGKEWNSTETYKITESMAEFFNYNRQKCALYFGGKYMLTKVFVGQGSDTKINPNIKTELIDSKTLNRRLGKLKKA